MLKEKLARKSKKLTSHQLQLNIDRMKEKDRNFDKGGRSFYFFDFDDNIAFLSTHIYVFRKSDGTELKLSSGEFAEHSAFIGKSGPLKDYEVRFDDESGSFRSFRDQDFSLVEKLFRKKQIFIQDLADALGYPDFHWKGPSWSCFYHAVFNQRPTSVITARGHHPETIKAGIKLFVEKGHLPTEPNYLSVFPVSHLGVRDNLNMGHETSIAKLKQAAIRASVQRAFEVYGYNPHHRFGMSDDDPKNIQLIIEEMARLKNEYNEVSFFVIETHRGNFIKREVFKDHTEDHKLTEKQLDLFPQ